MEQTYRFADKNVRIVPLYNAVHALCKDYAVPTSGYDFAVCTSSTDIDFERERSAQTDVLEGRPVRQSSDAYLETLAVYRKIAEKMPDYDTVLFHGSCVAVDGAGYLFIAKSGTGKSTHTRLWRELLGERAVMVNDDKPLIRITDGGAVIYGTPWDGKHRLSANIAVPLKAVCILERAAENSIRPISTKEAYPMLLQQVYRPMDGAAMSKTLVLVDRLASAVKLWKLGCNTQIEAAQVAYDAMKGHTDHEAER
ncbi:MAG: hypothetical protein K5784_05800 [Clostridiales bacterium]|nr:hypothetical protein [Clostridiales bacterium]